MFKFFRRIRKDLISNGKTSKYFKYAIGEILLVVIGILIALSINNVNEAKNNEARLVKILKEIRQDLENDVVAAQGRLKAGNEMDSLCNLVLDEKITQQDYIDRGDSDDLFWIGLQFWSFDFQKTAFNKFENFQGVIPEHYDVLLEDINNYYNVTGKLHNDVYAIFRQQIMDRHDYLANNMDWYYLMRKSKHTPEMIDFYLNNPMYRNWVSQHRADNINGKYGTVNDLHNKGIGLIFKITDILQDDYKLDNPEVVKKMGKPRDDLSQYSGKYSIEKFDNQIEISHVAGHLFANMQWHLKTIEKDSFTSFEDPNYHYKFKRNQNKIIGIQMYHLKDSTRSGYWKKEPND
ncbi:DUF6090 family protein [Ichthyenterobacterium sp. W332]|uniref:DUF6090 family protein n=1 Tax=Microcosmobacter mediterraneus TaxID=3075607 RepID=A0ABU2YKD0_9FLAO|nr:DUF6090 family protein [Ichthyenterobacterium sp. W332]MDT0558285.1 DUF6090 family protein [Ichthyenterobacterium sp. W332]